MCRAASGTLLAPVSGVSKAVESVVVAGVRITHPGKRLWPDEGITKLDLARYYEHIAPVMLRYVKDRPVTLRPFPKGIQAPGFYLKDAPRGAPPWVKTFTDVAASTSKPVDFVVVSDTRALVWAAQVNSVELHPWLSTVHRPDEPDWGVVDLDPFEGTPWARLAAAAKALRQQLEGHGLHSFPKLTGQTGVHLLVPLAPEQPYQRVRAFFERVARDASKAHPDLLTTDYTVADRGGRILVDYAQNARAKTTVAPYSARPKPGAPVAAPIRWEEMEGPGLRSNAWTLRTMLDRIKEVGDVLEPALTMRQRLPD